MRATIRPLREYMSARTGRRTAKTWGRRPTGPMGVLMLWLLVSSAQGGVEGRVVQSGFRGESGPCYRRGVWCPLRVELTLRGATSFSGVLRVAQPDADADVCVSEVRTYWLYALPNPAARLSGTDHPFQVSLIDETGAAVAFEDSGGTVSVRLTERQPLFPLAPSEILVLDISAQPLSRLSSAIRDVEPKMRRLLRLARTAPENVPAAWFGLEMADFVVWDAADPSVLEYRQVEALIEWVRRGGHLVLAASRTADVLSQSELGPLLPVEIGPTQTHRLMLDVQRKMLAMDGEREWAGGLVVCQTTLRSGARVKIEDEGLPFVSTTRVGHGSVTFVAAELGDLWRIEPETVFEGKADSPALRSGKLIDSLFGARQSSLRGDQGGTAWEPTDLFENVKRTVDFRARSGVFMGVALLFVIAYVLTATVVSWNWLKRRSWEHLNWTAFAVVVLLASAASLGAVGVVRGMVTELHQLSVVDLATESFQARATCYFGLKTARHTNLDLWLPSDPTLPEAEQPGGCALRPMPPVRSRGTSGFLSPQSYRARPVRAKLEGVPFRATLKQFVGQWAGELSSRFLGEMHVGAGEIGDRSWLENRLGLDLEGCYLLVARLDPCMERSAGYINVYDLGTIKDGQRIERVGSYVRELEESKKGAEARRGQEPAKIPTLKDLQDKWVRDLDPGLVPGFGRRREREIDPENYDKALLLLSTLKEYEAEAAGSGFGDPYLEGTHCRRLERSDLLSRDTVMLVGFSDQAGPVRLAVRNSRKKQGEFGPLRPGQARTMYRILIPVLR